MARLATIDYLVTKEMMCSMVARGMINWMVVLMMIGSLVKPVMMNYLVAQEMMCSMVVPGMIN